MPARKGRHFRFRGDLHVEPLTCAAICSHYALNDPGPLVEATVATRCQMLTALWKLGHYSVSFVVVDAIKEAPSPVFS